MRRTILLLLLTAAAWELGHYLAFVTHFHRLF